MSVPTANYITPEGHARLTAERIRLWTEERPVALREIELAAGNIDRWEKGNDSGGTRKRLQEIDRRIVQIDERLAVLEILDPSRHAGSRTVHFGARVTWRREDGRTLEATIVGPDETAFIAKSISCASPVALALLGRAVGDETVVETPVSEETLEILSVNY